MSATVKKETKVFSLVVNRLGQEQERSDKTENQRDGRWDGERLRNGRRVLIRPNQRRVG